MSGSSYRRAVPAAVARGMGTGRRRAAGAWLGAAGLCLAMPGVLAQQAGEAGAAEDGGSEAPSARRGVLEEMVITAQKREQDFQDVGIALSVFSGDQLRAFGVQDSYEVADIVPGVHTSGAIAGQNTQFTIRGVTQNDFNDIVEAPVAVYVDEG